MGVFACFGTRFMPFLVQFQPSCSQLVQGYTSILFVLHGFLCPADLSYFMPQIKPQTAEGGQKTKINKQRKGTCHKGEFI